MSKEKLFPHVVAVQALADGIYMYIESETDMLVAEQSVCGQRPGAGA